MLRLGASLVCGRGRCLTDGRVGVDQNEQLAVGVESEELVRLALARGELGEGELVPYAGRVGAEQLRAEVLAQ